MDAGQYEMQVLRTLILKSQHESLSESEIAELNALVCTERGAVEAAALLDQLGAFTDSGALDSLPMAEVLCEALGSASDTAMASALKSPAAGRRTSSKPSAGRADQVQSTRSGRFLRPLWWVAIAASYLLVATVAWSLANPPSLSVDPIVRNWASIPTVRSGANSIFPASTKLVSMTACVWRPTGEPIPTLGDHLNTGDSLSLMEGIAELKLGEGTAGEAMVRIEGPARVNIRSDGQLEIQHGSMTAKSLKTGTGNLMIDTPLGRVIVDGLSSVGLVARETESEVHLFSGSAQINPYQSASLTPNFDLQAGEAIRISGLIGGGSTIVKFNASKSAFVSARSLGFDPLNLDTKYVQAVMESGPSVYWRFEQLMGSYPYQIENLGSADGMDAVVVGEPTWRQYGKNRVAELGHATSSAFRALQHWPPQPLDEYSIEAWVKPQLFHHGELVCLHASESLEDGRYPHTIMLETTARHDFDHVLVNSPANRFRFIHRELGSDDPISKKSLFSVRAYKTGVWQHMLAQVKDGKQMLWIDGNLAGEADNAVPMTANVQILVGQVYPNSSHRRFVGQIDEIAIYDRCITPEEMRSHLRAAGRDVAPVQVD